jgi:ADP-ribose pyrophosphatase YjhB (NUDIX family)
MPDGTVVLMRRRDSEKWGFPGGLMDWGEDAVTTAQRELAEETGLAVDRIGRLVGVYSSPDRDPRFHAVSIVLEVFVTGIPRIADPAEASAVQAFDWNCLKDLDLAHDHARIVVDYQTHKTVVA